MTTQTNRDLQKQQTRLRIFTAAINLIKVQGYQATTIRQITQAAHVSAGAFYVYYKSKDDIIRRSYYEDLAIYVADHYQKYLDSHPHASLHDKILAFSLLQLQLSTEQGWQVVAMVFTSFFTEVLDSSVQLRDWTMLDTLRNLMVEANQQDLLINQDPNTSFNQLYTSIRGMMATWAYSRGSFDLVDNAQDYLNNILKSLITDEHVH